MKFERDFRRKLKLLKKLRRRFNFGPKLYQNEVKYLRVVKIKGV